MQCGNSSGKSSPRVFMAKLKYIACTNLCCRMPNHFKEFKNFSCKQFLQNLFLRLCIQYILNTKAMSFKYFLLLLVVLLFLRGEVLKCTSLILSGMQYLYGNNNVFLHWMLSITWPPKISFWNNWFSRLRKLMNKCITFFT